MTRGNTPSRLRRTSPAKEPREKSMTSCLGVFAGGVSRRGEGVFATHSVSHLP
jgi:hypothetical protein